MAFGIFVQTHTGRRGYLTAESIQGGEGIEAFPAVAIEYVSKRDAESKIETMGWTNCTSFPTVGVTAYVCRLPPDRGGRPAPAI